MNSNTILNTDYLDILFEGRNKKYGGYELRRKYNRRITIATIATILLTAALFIGKAVADRMKPEPVVVEKQEETPTDIAEIEPPPMDEKEPPPPEAPETPPPPVKPTVQFTPPVITDQPIKEDERPPTEKEQEDKVSGPTNAEGTPDGAEPGLTPEVGNGPVGPVAAPEAPNPNEIVSKVDRPASYPGLYAYLQQNLRYPDADREEGHQGKVFIQFVVNLDGSIQDVKVSKTSGFPALDQEALRVIRIMPKWKPGEVAGKPVRSIFKQPVTFRLD